jgi:hypothetical protein
VDLSFSYLEPPSFEDHYNMAEELYHAFTVIPGVRYRVMVIAEQSVNEQWIQMSQTAGHILPYASPDPEDA